MHQGRINSCHPLGGWRANSLTDGRNRKSFLSTLRPRVISSRSSSTPSLNGSRTRRRQLGAALAYYTVFSLAPLILVLLAIIGVIFRDDPAGAWNKITEQMCYFLDPERRARSCRILRRRPRNLGKHCGYDHRSGAGPFRCERRFRSLQDALNTIWGVKAKPGAGFWGFLRVRFLSFRDGGAASVSCFSCRSRSRRC